ncbi:MAG: MurT ligase domain-containing protein [Ktedonobacteraceae bacterium]
MPKQKLPRLVSRERRSGKSNRPWTQKDKTSGSKNSSHATPAAKRASQHTSLRAGFAVMGGRTMGALSRRLHLGGGTSVVGIVAQRLYPDIVGHLAAQLEHGSIIVTGTNGKTTTSGLIAAILSDAGLRVWRNREGSNLMRGVASSLVIRALPNGNLRRSGAAISIFEVDEAVVPQMVEAIPPRVAVFTNLFRDQLDRYGEVDSVATRWVQAVKALPNDTTLVLNADDSATAYLGELFTGNVLYFGIDDPALDLKFQQSASERHQVIDTRTCPKCGNEYTYDLRFFSHMGHYVCTNCGHKRPQADVRVTKVLSDDFDRLRIHVVTAKHEGDIVIPLPGLYNIYNALAAIATSQVLHTDWEPVVTGIEQFKPMFGRGERVQIEGRTLRLLLAKNPTGFNEVLRTLFNEETPRHVLFVLNDNSADGRDISWIWDVDFERVVNQTTTLIVSGTRALDLALRLKYAGVAQEEMTIVPATPLRASRREKVAHNRNSRDAKNIDAGTESIVQGVEVKLNRRYGIVEAINNAVQQTPVGETLFIVPTYTGLLEIHRELEQRGLTPHYWEGRDE